MIKIKPICLTAAFYCSILALTSAWPVSAGEKKRVVAQSTILDACPQKDDVGKCCHTDQNTKQCDMWCSIEQHCLPIKPEMK